MLTIPHNSEITTDPVEIERALTAWGTGVCEVRVLGPRRPRFYGPQVVYGDLPADRDVLVKLIASISGDDAGGVYLTANPLDPAVLGRGRGRLVPARNAAADADVLARRLLPIDIDPVRPSGVNANAAEIVAASERTAVVVEWLSAQSGFPVPLFRGTSGSGGLLLYRIELPNDAQARDEVQALLVALSDALSDDRVKIDTSISNAARCVRIPGTINAKSVTPQPDRPWTRVSGIWSDEDPEVTHG